MALSPVALRQLLDKKRLLVFDFDGTLADTSHLHAAAFNEVLRPWGLTVDYPTIAGMRTLEALSSCFAAARIEMTQARLQQLVQDKQASVRARIRAELRPLPGVDDFLRWAQSRFRLAMYSSGSRGTVTLAIDKLGFTDWFDPMVCAEDVLHAKPHPEGFLKVLDILGAQAGHALVFEDSDMGIQAARQAGLETIDVRATSFEALRAFQGIDP